MQSLRARVGRDLIVLMGDWQSEFPNLHNFIKSPRSVVTDSICKLDERFRKIILLLTIALIVYTMYLGVSALKLGPQDPETNERLLTQILDKWKYWRNILIGFSFLNLLTMIISLGIYAFKKRFAKLLKTFAGFVLNLFLVVFSYPIAMTIATLIAQAL